jgi:serine/threonine-protein kinase
MATCPTCRTRYDGGEDACPVDGASLLPDEAFSAADRDLEPGELVGEYRVEGRLGEGTYGTVYRGVHPVIGKAAAIKVLKRQYSANPEMVSRFISEARAVNQIRHRNIIDIFSFGLLPDGRHYYVMEVLEGRSLEDVVKERGRLTPDEAMPILRQLARALGAAHAAGIYHRDIKPENVFLGFDDDGQPVPKLLDFGIAKLHADEGRHKTRSGTPMGTPLYMSPEQIRGGPIDHRADIYSFGVLVHEILTGSVPFDGTSVIDVLMKHTSAQAPAMSSVCADVPGALDAPVLHMLEKEPAHRPPTIVAAVDALLVAAGVPAASPSLTAGGSLAVRGGGAASMFPVGPVDRSAAEARTVEAGRTLRGAERAVVGSRPPPGRRALWPAAAGAALVAVAAIVVARAPTAPAEEAPPTAAAPGERSPVVASAPVAVPLASLAAPPPSAAPRPSTVTLTIRATPPDAEVWRGGDKIGIASAPIELPRAEGNVELVLRKPGFQDKPVDVPAGEASTLSVELLPLRVRPPRPPRAQGGDLEF